MFLTKVYFFNKESSTNHLLFICVCKCRVPIEDCGIPDISNHLAARPTYYLFASLLSFYPFVFCMWYIWILDFLYFLTHPTIWFPDPPTISFHFLAPGMMAPMGESKASMSNNNNANEKPKEGAMIVRQDDNNWTVSGSICFGEPAL